MLKRSLKDYDKEISELKKEYPQFNDRINGVLPLMEDIISSDKPFDTLNNIVSQLDAMDAYVLGMIFGIIIKNKTDILFSM